jgi:hypothetical protein
MLGSVEKKVAFILLDSQDPPVFEASGDQSRPSAR